MEKVERISGREGWAHGDIEVRGEKESMLY